MGLPRQRFRNRLLVTLSLSHVRVHPELRAVLDFDPAHNVAVERNEVLVCFVVDGRGSVDLWT